MATLEEFDFAKMMPAESYDIYLTTQQRPCDDLSQITKFRSGNCFCPCNNQNQGGIFIIMVVITVASHKVLLLCINNNRSINIPFTSSGVGLHLHGSCLYACILLLKGLSLLPLPINREF